MNLPENRPGEVPGGFFIGRNVDLDIDRNGKRSYNEIPKIKKCFENSFRFLPEGLKGEPSYSPKLNCMKDSLLSDVRLPGGNLSLFEKPLVRGFFSVIFPSFRSSQGDSEVL